MRALHTLKGTADYVQASTSTIAATVDAMSERLDLGKVFRNAPTGAVYTLRGIICYFSHHYQVPGFLSAASAAWEACIMADVT